MRHGVVEIFRSTSSVPDFIMPSNAPDSLSVASESWFAAHVGGTRGWATADAVRVRTQASRRRCEGAFISRWMHREKKQLIEFSDAIG